jgi:hypothetical protein
MGHSLFLLFDEKGILAIVSFSERHLQPFYLSEKNHTNVRILKK